MVRATLQVKEGVRPSPGTTSTERSYTSVHRSGEVSELAVGHSAWWGPRVPQTSSEGLGMREINGRHPRRVDPNSPKLPPQPQGTCFLSTSDFRPPLPPCSRKLHLYKLQFISAILFSKSPCSYGRDIQLHQEGIPCLTPTALATNHLTAARKHSSAQPLER